MPAALMAFISGLSRWHFPVGRSECRESAPFSLRPQYRRRRSLQLILALVRGKSKCDRTVARLMSCGASLGEVLIRSYVMPFARVPLLPISLSERQTAARLTGGYTARQVQRRSESGDA
jgi:hypothetical protein